MSACGSASGGKPETRFVHLQQAARACLEERDRDRKVARTLEAAGRWSEGLLEPGHSFVEDGEPAAGLPEGLVLTEPTKVPRRGLGSSAGLAAFVHAIAHIEWNAVNLAWDAVGRFAGMPRDYYDDWVRVAAEEATHFSMLRSRLLQLGHDYGDFQAHDGLWRMAESTRHDLLDRMALVPRILEARGLDVTPPLIARLRAGGDEATASILDVVYREEIGHVRIGSRWFHHLCRERGLEPAPAFAAALGRHFRGRVKGVEAGTAREVRRDAGFLEDELEVLARHGDG